MSMSLDSFGGRLRFELERAKIKQCELAQSCDTHEANVSYWINGRFEPGVTSLRKILLVLPDTDARWLLTGIRDRAPSAAQPGVG